MSKTSRKASRKRRKHAQKKNKMDETALVFASNKKKLRLVGYMSNPAARIFFKMLCIKNANEDTFGIKFKIMHSVLCTRISVYTFLTDIPRVYQLLSDLTLNNGHYFQYITCRESTVKICDENLCVVGSVAPDEVDQFRSDLKFSDSGNNVEVVVHQLPDNDRDLIIEIYADSVNCEFVSALLEDGWMSDKWKKQFHQVK